MSFEVSEYIDIVNKVTEKLNLPKPKYLSKGENGVAFELSNDLILKLTSDKSEVIENSKILNKNLKYLAKPFYLHKLNWKNSSIYVILLEKLKTNETLFENNLNQLNKILNTYLRIDMFDIIDAFFYDKELFNEYTGKIKPILNKNVKINKFYEQILNIADELLLNKIYSVDFLNPRNLGYKKNGTLGYFDIGAGDDRGSDESINILNINERILSFMPNTQRVKIKKACMLGGGKTCNQGDINNLELSENNGNFFTINNKNYSKNYVKMAWNNLSEKQRVNRLHKSWYDKALNGIITANEWKHFLYLLKNGNTMYGDGKLTTKNESAPTHNEKDYYYIEDKNVSEVKNRNTFNQIEGFKKKVSNKQYLSPADFDDIISIYYHIFYNYNSYGSDVGYENADEHKEFIYNLIRKRFK